MPTIVQTVSGIVTGLWGSAKIRDAHGGDRALQIGDVVTRGDVILTSPDGIVQLTPERDDTAPAAPRVPPADAGSGEIDRVIGGLDQPRDDDAPTAGLAGGGEGDLQPGLRVDRVVESVTPAGLSTSGFEPAPVATADGAPAREAANQAPTADAASRQVAEDTPLTLALSGRDADGSIRAVTVTTLPEHGTLALADGTAVNAGQVLTPQQAAAVRFTPDAGFDGDTAIGFTVTDDDGAVSAAASVAIRVTAVNDAPAATPATLAVAEDTPLAVSLAGSDADGRVAAITVTQLPDHGTLFLADGTTPVAAGSPLAPADAARLVFVPAADFHGDDGVVFTVTDDAGAVSAAARVAIAVSAVADAPVARDDAAATDEDTPLTLTPAALLGNDGDADGDPLTLVSVQNAVGGTVALVGGNVVFTPAADFNGPASFGYTVSDGHGGSASATVAVGVAPVVDPAIWIGDVTVDERAGVATFVVSLSEPTTATVSVGYASVDGSASSGSGASPEDYTAASGTLTFAPGVTRQTVSVTIGDDRVFEGAETFAVELRTPVNATLGRATGTGTITDDGSGPPGGGAGQPADDDRPTLSVSGGNVVEGEFAVFGVALSNPSTQPVVFRPALVSGSATVGVDTGPVASLELSLDGGSSWSPVGGDVVVPPNALSVLLRVPTTADALHEGNEAFTLTATPVGGSAAPAAATGEATLIDADGAPSLFIGDVTVDEAAGTATFTVWLSSASALPVTVGFSTADIAGAAGVAGTGDAATAGSDYGAVSGTLAFAPGVTRQTITVPIADDAVLEGAERFHVVLSAPVNALLGNDTATGTIRDDGTGPAPTPGTPPDDDTPAVGSVSSPTAVEGGALDFAVGLTHTSTTPTTVALNLMSGSATVGSDTATPLQVSFDGGRTFAPLAGATVEVPAGAAGFVVRVPTVDDALSEPTEALTLSASTAANPAPVTGSGTIVDNDGTPALSISGPPVVDEAAGTATYTVVLSHPSASIVTVSYGSVDGTATAGQDFVAAGGTLTFAPNELTKTISVAITDDAVFEGPERFSLALSAPTGATLGGSAVASTTIRDDGTGPAANPDDDMPRIGSVSSASVVEGGDLDFTVALTHASTTPTAVVLGLASGSATVGTDTAGPLQVSFDGGRSFVPVTGATVEVPAGVGSFVVRAATLDDAISEPTESLTLSASTPAGPASAAAATVVGSGTIGDNDGTPVLSISGPAVVDEAAGTATYTVTLSNPSASAVSVDYGSVDGSAVAGQDFSAAAGTLTFAPNELTKTVTVAITDDAVFEGPESFSLALSAPVGATLAAAAVATTSIRDDGTGPSPGPGTMPDDDRPAVGSVSSPTVVEGGALDFVVGLTHPSTTPTVVTLATAAGSTTPGVDTDGGPLQVSFDGGQTFTPLAGGPTVEVPAGTGSFVVRVATIDDAQSESAETLTLAASTPRNAAPVVGTGTIVDNDGTPELAISGPAVIDEAAGTATYTVSLSHPSASAVSVGYATVDGTAVAGQDYGAANGTLSFAPNELTKTITVAIRNDAVFEGSETFSVALNTPVGATIAGGTVVSTIRDDGSAPGAAPDNDTPKLSLTGPAVIDEAAGTATYTVTLSNPSTSAVSVGYGTVDGTAVAGQDYSAANGTLTFAPNELTKTITVAIRNDAVFEGSETFSVALNTPTGATIANGSVVSTIQDDGSGPGPTPNDDRPAVGSVSSPTVSEGGNLDFAVHLTHPSSTPTTVALTPSSGSATLGTDTTTPWQVSFNGGSSFAAVGGATVVVPAGVTDFIVRVATVDDRLVEPTETITLAVSTPANAGAAAIVATGSIVDNEQTFFADAASGLRGEYYGYNEARTTAAGYRTHSDDGTATFGNQHAVGNLNSVEDMYTVIDGRNAAGGGTASLVGSAAAAAKDVADVVFSARSIDYGFNPTVSGALGSNSAVAAGSALPAGDGNAHSSTRSLENFLDQDRSTAVAQVGAGNTNGSSGLGTTTDAAIRVAGQIYVQPGSYDFRVTADDGFRLNVAGQTLLEFDGNQGPTTRIFNHVQLGDAGGGLQAMELLYWEQGGDARLRIEYKSSNDPDGAYQLLDVTTTAMFSSETAPVFSDPLIQDLVRDDAAGGWRVRTGVALDGTAGNDTLAGTDGRDVLNGGDGNDTLNGGAGADTLNGGAGNDVLTGGAGNDRLTGGAGADRLVGGSGDDTYVLSDRLDTIVENAGEGFDTVVLDAGYVAANAGTSYALAANLENATAEGGAAVNLAGNAADNRLEGNAGANTLDGGAGNDVLIGGAGNDRLTGGAGHDVFEWRLADAGTPGAPAVDTVTDFTYGGGYSNVAPTRGGDVLDLRDLLQGEHTSSGATGNAASAIEISNLLNYIDVQVSGADTVLHISKNGGFAGGSFSAGAEDQTIVLQNVNLYAATGVAAGDESSLLKTLIRNGTMVVD